MGSNMVLTGNYAAAEAAALCRPDLVAAYPITPQSSVVEHLAEMVHEGRLDTERRTGRCSRRRESVHRHERSRTSSHV